MELTIKQIKEFINNNTIKGFEIIHDKLTSDSIDPDDANEHEVVLKEIITGKYFLFTYDEWITDDPIDNISEITEVFFLNK